MAFRLDISDMERHKVEFRLACAKAKRRFTQAKMLDAYEKILQDHLTNASDDNTQENRIEIHSISQDTTDRLSDFIKRLINLANDAHQRELLHECMRRSLIHARYVQAADGIRVDPMCLMCMGLFSSNALAVQNEPPLYQSTPFGRITDREPNADDAMMDHDHGQQQPIPDIIIPASPVYQQHANIDEFNTNLNDPTGFDNHPHYQNQEHQQQKDNNGDQPSPVSPDQYIDDTQARDQRRAQQSVPYQPQFNIPPTPDEDVIMDTDNQDNSTAAAVAATGGPGAFKQNGYGTTTNQDLNPNAREDSIQDLFKEGNHKADAIPNMVSSPLKEFIKSQKTAFQYCPPSIEDSDEEEELKSDSSSDTTVIDQGKKRSTTISTTTTTTNNKNKKKVVAKAKTATRSAINKDLANATSILDTNLEEADANGAAAAAGEVAPAQSPERTQWKQVSSIDVQIKNSIKKAQMDALQISQVLVSPSSKSNRNSMSNSKQFVKRTKKRTMRPSQ